MNVINETLLTAFRSKPRCECCFRLAAVQPHHLTCKGMGGARRFDLAINLIALCVECHQRFHNGRLPAGDLLAIVARREKTSPQAIKEEIWRLRRE